MRQREVLRAPRHAAALPGGVAAPLPPEVACARMATSLCLEAYATRDSSREPSASNHAGEAPGDRKTTTRREGAPAGAPRSRVSTARSATDPAVPQECKEGAHSDVSLGAVQSDSFSGGVHGGVYARCMELWEDLADEAASSIGEQGGVWWIATAGLLAAAASVG
ncbi:hypothetical protein T484DRAFT_1904095, partial [Baffinella frigidus]